MSGNLQGQNLATMLVSSGAAGIMPTSYGYYPHEGSRVVSAAYSWATQTGYVEDLSQLVARGVETTIQSAWIDNSQCTQAVTIMISGSDQVLVIPANSQGCYPFLCTGAPGFQISVAATVAGGLTRVGLLNLPVTMGPWPTSGGGLTATIPAKAGASTSIVAGGTAQTAVAAGAITSEALIKNPNGATESLFLDLVHPAGLVDGAGGTTFELLPGDTFVVPGVSTSVSVNAATTGHGYIVTVI